MIFPVNMNSALIVTDCEMSTLKRHEDFTVNITLMKSDMEELSNANLSHCFAPEISISQLLPAFIPLNRDLDYSATQFSFADMNNLPYDKIYETISTYDREQLNICSKRENG